MIPADFQQDPRENNDRVVHAPQYAAPPQIQQPQPWHHHQQQHPQLSQLPVHPQVNHMQHHLQPGQAGHYNPQFPGHICQVQVVYYSMPAPAQAPWEAPAAPIAPHENDVLLGRGGKNNTHIGNEKLRKLARELREEYCKSSKKEKSELSRRLVKDVHAMDPPGRFLRRNHVTSAWEVVDVEYAREKTSQCLRDAVTEGPMNDNIIELRIHAREFPMSGNCKKDDGDDSESDSESDHNEGRTATPIPSAGNDKEESPVITPESSPKTRSRTAARAGDIPDSIILDPSNCHSKHQEATSARSPVTSNANLTSLSRAEARDGPWVEGWMRIPGELARSSSPLPEPTPWSEMCEIDAMKSAKRRKSEFAPPSTRARALYGMTPSILGPEGGAGRPSRNSLAYTNSPWNVPPLEVGTTRHGDADERKQLDQQMGIPVRHHTVHNVYKSRSDNHYDTMGIMETDDTQSGDYEPMPMEEAVLLGPQCVDSKTEEMLMMMMDPFATEFF